MDRLPDRKRDLSTNPNDADYETTFTRRVWIMIPAAQRTNVNTQLENLGYGPDNFRVELVAVGEADDSDATWIGCFWQMNASQWTNFLALCATAPLIKYAEMNEKTRALVSQRHQVESVNVGTVMDVEALLAQFGLKRRVVEMD